MQFQLDIHGELDALHVARRISVVPADAGSYLPSNGAVRATTALAQRCWPLPEKYDSEQALGKCRRR